MTILLELIFELFGELFIEVFVESLFELGFHGTAEKLSAKGKGGSRWLLAFIYAAFGSAIGWLSLFVFPPFEFDSALKVAAYIIGSSIVAGFALSVVSWIINRGIRPVRVIEPDKFLFGVVFALGYAIARVVFR
jgi:hypothetical protein